MILITLVDPIIKVLDPMVLLIFQFWAQHCDKTARIYFLNRFRDTFFFNSIFARGQFATVSYIFHHLFFDSFMTPGQVVNVWFWLPSWVPKVTILKPRCSPFDGTLISWILHSIARDSVIFEIISPWYFNMFCYCFGLGSDTSSERYMSEI